MSDLITRLFEGQPVRTVMLDDELYFVSNDVNERLGYVNANAAVTRHCRGAPKHYPLQTAGGMQNSRVLNEADVLRLIVGSKLEAAQRFERWVFEEVLPSVRKTGSYGAPAQAQAVDFNNPKFLQQLLLQHVDKEIELEKAVAELSPKAAALDRIATATDGSLTLRESAKLLQVQPKKLGLWMQENGWVYRPGAAKPMLGYQTKIDAGLLEHKINTYEAVQGDKVIEKKANQVLITAKGLARLAELLEHRDAEATVQ
jgi:prophage antirepressor-like protein